MRLPRAHDVKTVIFWTLNLGSCGAYKVRYRAFGIFTVTESSIVGPCLTIANISLHRPS